MHNARQEMLKELACYCNLPASLRMMSRKNLYSWLCFFITSKQPETRLSEADVVVRYLHVVLEESFL